jgi:hypothetical protein
VVKSSLYLLDFSKWFIWKGKAKITPYHFFAVAYKPINKKAYPVR